MYSKWSSRDFERYVATPPRKFSLEEFCSDSENIHSTLYRLLAVPLQGTVTAVGVDPIPLNHVRAIAQFHVVERGVRGLTARLRACVHPYAGEGAAKRPHRSSTSGKSDYERAARLVQ